MKQFGTKGQTMSSGEAQAFVIINNLLMSLEFSSQSDMVNQIRLKKNTIIGAIKNCMKWDLDVVGGNHYPSTLENAQACWMCKQRVYIYCPTCSQSERKRTCLCIKCYELYHKEKMA
jgi:hypothetical protein